MDKALIKKYCNNKCTEEELNSVLEWFQLSAESKEGEALLFRLWVELQDEKDSVEINFESLLERIHHEIYLTYSKSLFQEKDAFPYKVFNRKVFVKILSRAAAILLIPLMVYGLYITVRYQSLILNEGLEQKTNYEVFSPVDAIIKVSLPDGSTVWLNRSSSLIYPAVFHDNTRAVELKGEGYFEVASDSKNPFIVSAGDIRIKATGTEFNIMAYMDENKIVTSLINGQVELLTSDPEGKKTLPLILKPTDMAVFQKSTNQFLIKTTKDNSNFSWKDGRLVFDNEPMSDVVRKLSRWFNCEFEIKDPELLNLTYTATFIDETLLQVMDLIAMVSPVSYSISNREKNSSGTFYKRKIILKYRK